VSLPSDLVQQLQRLGVNVRSARQHELNRRGSVEQFRNDPRERGKNLTRVGFGQRSLHCRPVNSARFG
jgi:hypothetical protein